MTSSADLTWGVVALLGLVLGLAIAMTMAARVSARLLGVPTFRWFDERAAPATSWQMVCVRGAAALAPFCVSALLFCVAFLANGVPKASEHVEVLAGPAREAGLRDGDRIARVGTRPVANWEEMRNAMQRSTGPTRIEVERKGQRLELLVTPREGKIGVSRQMETERVGIVAAAKQAVVLPWTVVRASAQSLAYDVGRSRKTELMGPIGAADSVGSGTTRLFTLAVLAAYLWPILAGFCGFDAITGGIFHAWHPEARSSTLSGYRLQRYRQALLVALLGYAAMCVLCGLAAVGASPALALAALTAPMVVAGYPLLWIASKGVWSRPVAVISVLAAGVVPCFFLVVGVLLLSALWRRLRAEGFRVGWLRAEPP